MKPQNGHVRVVLEERTGPPVLDDYLKTVRSGMGPDLTCRWSMYMTRQT